MLITLGIIGVVAAITIPSLINNYQKKVMVNRLKENYSLIIQGFRKYMSDNDASDLTGAEWRTSEEAFNKFWHGSFKVQQDCKGKYTPCFAPEYRSLSGAKVSTKGFFCNVTLVLMNGAAICADAVADVKEKDDGGNKLTTTFKGQHLVNVEIDVNGSAPPNAYGLDMFAFSINQEGMIYDPTYNEKGFLPNYKWIDNGAVGKIIADGWKITYPVK